jgi:hypothetical protein
LGEIQIERLMNHQPSLLQIGKDAKELAAQIAAS